MYLRGKVNTVSKFLARLWAAMEPKHFVYVQYSLVPRMVKNITTDLLRVSNEP